MKKLLIIIFFVLFLCSCRSEDSANDNGDKLISGNYEAYVQMQVTGSEKIQTYSMTQHYMKPDKVRIEIEEPDYIKGEIITGCKGIWNIYSPVLNSSFNSKSLRDKEELFYMGIYQEELIAGAHKTGKVKFLDRDCELYRTTLKNETDHRKTADIYIDEQTKVPVALIIKDDKRKDRVIVKYSRFIYKKNMDEKIFIIN